MMGYTKWCSHCTSDMISLVSGTEGWRNEHLLSTVYIHMHNYKAQPCGGLRGIAMMLVTQLYTSKTLFIEVCLSVPFVY